MGTKKRAALCDQARVPTYTESEFAYFFLGTNRFSKLIRNEINAFIHAWNEIKSTVTAVATFNRAPVLELVIDGLMITLRLGLTCLLPWRLLLTACQEGRYFVERAITKTGRYLAPNNRFVQTSFHLLSLLAGLYLAFQFLPYFSFSMVLGFQLFPETWSWSFIFSLSLAFSAAELLAGIVLGIGQRIVAFARGTGHAPVDNVLELNADPEQREIPAPTLVEDNPLTFNTNSQQKVALLRVLNARLHAQDIGGEERQTIGAELINLNNQQRPYSLSQFDLQLLRANAAANNDTLPPAFEAARARIFSSSQSNSV